MYHSVDNLLWEAVPGVTSTMGRGVLRYMLRFPEIDGPLLQGGQRLVNNGVAASR